MLVLTREDVRAVLDPDELVDALARAFVDLSEGAASMPPRIAALVPARDGMVAAMPAFVPGIGALTTKLVSLFPSNVPPMPTHQAVIVVFDADTGEPAALLDGTYITAARTAAGSALSTRLLARDDARILAILGTGVQARAHIDAVARTRAFEEVRITGRSVLSARAIADELGIRAVDSFEEAIDGADVVCATTHALDPVVRREWLAPGTHVTSVGYNPAGREIDPETIRDAVVVVESRVAALAEPPTGSNDLRWAIRDGFVGPDVVHAELGELIAGTKPGRTDAEQITLYKSVGVAVEDAAAAALVLRRAREQGVGRSLDL